jgi:hypothetical protein
MTDTNQNDVLNFPQEKKVPGLLNVLTILTLIWSAYELYSTISNYFKGDEAIKKLEEAQDKMQDAPGWLRKLAGPEVLELTRKAIENKLPMTILGLVAIGLCVYGALEMRKLKKQGYYLWLIGEVLPIVSMAIFVGGSFFQTIFAYFLIFPIIFILLYTSQVKHLK